MTPLHHAQAAVMALIQRAEWLDASLAPGTPRPYRPSTLTAEAREAADALARAERLERVDIAPGDSPDPIWSEGVELRTELLTLADAMAERVAQTAGVERMPDAGWDSPAIPYLQHVSKWLAQAVDAEPDLANNVELKCRQYVARLDAVLGHVTDGQQLDALCPWCAGKADGHPTGGAKTLRVRTLPGIGPSIVCEGGYCEPESDSGHRYRGGPAWPQWEWDWLADRLRRLDEAA